MIEYEIIFCDLFDKNCIQSINFKFGSLFLYALYYLYAVVPWTLKKILLRFFKQLKTLKTKGLILDRQRFMIFLLKTFWYQAL